MRKPEGLEAWQRQSVRQQAYTALTVSVGMYYRINTISFDASRKDEFIAYFGTMRDEMKKIAGVQSITIIETGEGEATGVAIYDSQASAEAALPQIQTVMGGMAHRPTRTETRSRNVVNVI